LEIHAAPILTDAVVVSDCWLKAKTLSRPSDVPKSQKNKMSSTEATAILCFEVLVVFTYLPFFQPQPLIIKRRIDLAKLRGRGKNKMNKNGGKKEIKTVTKTSQERKKNGLTLCSNDSLPLT